MVWIVLFLFMCICFSFLYVVMCAFWICMVLPVVMVLIWLFQRHSLILPVLSVSVALATLA